MKALSSDVRAAVPLEIIQEMYRVEREAGEQALPPENRRTLRQSKTQPLLNQLGDWVKEVHPSTPPKSPLGQALTYLLNQWTALSRFLEDGRLLLDNNDCERALRHVAVGRKNYLFAGSDAGGERAAAIYTVLRTAHLHGVEPAAYLQDILEKMAGGWPQARIEELLPPFWKPGQS